MLNAAVGIPAAAFWFTVYSLQFTGDSLFLLSSNA